MKKLFTLLLSLAMLVSLAVPAFATELEGAYTQEEINAINEVNIAKYAKSFVDAVSDDPDLESGDVLTIYSENDKISGYCIDIVKDSLPNGYVVVKFSNNEPVVSEFSLGAGVQNPYEVIMERDNIGTEDAIFYSIGSNDYQVLDLKHEVMASSDTTELVSEKEFMTYKEDAKEIKQAELQTITDSDDGLNYSDLDGWSVVSDNYEGTVKNGMEHTITGADDIDLWYCGDHVENNNRTYACSVVALCNLAKYYRENGYDKISRSFTTLYDTMWDYAGTNDEGTTSNGREAPAAQRYLNELGYKCTYSSYLFDNYGDFTKDLDKNKPCIFSYGAKFGNKKGGHAVFAVGYVETTEYQYLQIADGWNDYLRYINFNGYDYTKTDGWSFSVSK